MSFPCSKRRGRSLAWGCVMIAAILLQGAETGIISGAAPSMRMFRSRARFSPLHLRGGHGIYPFVNHVPQSTHVFIHALHIACYLQGWGTLCRPLMLHGCHLTQILSRISRREHLYGTCQLRTISTCLPLRAPLLPFKQVLPPSSRSLPGQQSPISPSEMPNPRL